MARAQDDLSPIERYGLVDDAWAAVLADQMSAVEFLEMARQFGTEDDVSVWRRLIGGLGVIDRLVDGDARNALATQVRELVGPELARLGREPRPDDTDRDRERRGVLVAAAGVLGADPDIEVFARGVLAATDDGNVDPSLLASAIDIVADQGRSEDFDRFLARFKSASTPQEELRYLYALAGFDQPELVDRLVAICLTDEIRSQNAPYVLGRAMANRQHGPRAWAFVRDHWDEVNERFPSNSIVRMLGGLRSLWSAQVADDVYAFFEEHEVPQGDKQLAQHLERLEVNVALGRPRRRRPLASPPAPGVSTDAPRRGPWVFGVDIDRIQLTWRDLGAGPVEVRTTATDTPAPAVVHRFDAEDGPGSMQVTGLPPGRPVSLVFDAPHRGRWRRTVRTLVPPPGPELFRFATISDLHLGEEGFGFLGRMSEEPGRLEPYAVRAARAAVDEIEEWGAQLLVAKGDLTDSGRLADWDQFADITAGRGFPVLAIPGNHDTWEPGRSMVHPLRRPPTDTDEAPRLSPGQGLARLGLSHDPIWVRDEPGLRIVAVDTTRPDSRSGRIAHLADDVVDTVAASSAPAVVILHHQLMTSPVPTHLPIGIAQTEADPFLDALGAGAPGQPGHLGPHASPPVPPPRPGGHHRGGLHQGLPGHLGGLRRPPRRHPPGGAPGGRP